MARKKKRVLLFFQLVIISAIYSLPAHSQPIPFDKKYADSILIVLSRLPDDSVKVNHLVTLSKMFFSQNGDTTIAFAVEGAALAKKIGYTTGLISCLKQQAFYYGITADWPKATVAINELSRFLENFDKAGLIFVYNMKWLVSVTKADTLEALKWALMSIHHPDFQKLEEIGRWASYMQITRTYETLNQLDSAEFYAAYLKAFIPKYGELIPDLKYNSLEVLGDIAFKRRDYEGALINYRLGESKLGLAKTFHQLKQSDSAIHYALLTISNTNNFQAPGYILEGAQILEREYAVKDPVTALKYLRLTMEVKDKLYNVEKVKQMEAVTLNQQQLEFDRQAAETAERNRLFRTIFFLVLAFLSLFLFVLWRSYNAKRIANHKLEKSFSDLKATQAQLIQSEKMASLGELTAGVAHEIQNPLNFVNNFSDVNQELILELKDELGRGNMQEVEKIADSIHENESKINHHGKRADAIVKNMLQHSRSSTRQIEPTDLNALCDEYLRLSYHGLRAKDKSFNATLETDYGLTVGKAKVIPQDMGRVMLNLFNNAFYAVTEKNKVAESNFHPTVSISTRRVDDKIQIIVKDNGSGIPKKLQEKIFQPFFTTKPTGLGTGLGLSLSYDIIKSHGGEILVKSSPGEGTVFTINLPD